MIIFNTEEEIHQYCWNMAEKGIWDEEEKFWVTEELGIALQEAHSCVYNPGDPTMMYYTPCAMVHLRVRPEYMDSPLWKAINE